jgi:hypothetical protein
MLEGGDVSARFEIESKCIREANEAQFAVYRAWLRDTVRMTVKTFDGPTRDSVKTQAVAAARAVTAEFAFICRRDQIGI